MLVPTGLVKPISQRARGGGAVPLSEHEQRLLEQMERALYAEDPKLASVLRGHDLRGRYRRRAVLGVLGVVVGLALLPVGIAGKIVPLSVAGFLVMLGSAIFAVTSWRRRGGRRTSACLNRAPASSSRSRPSAARRAAAESTDAGSSRARQRSRLAALDSTARTTRRASAPGSVPASTSTPSGA